MNKEQRFSASLSRGKRGEIAVAATLANRGWEVVDVRDSQHYRNIDVDFRIHKSSENLHLSVEVKSDAFISFTGNLLLEVYNSNNVKRDGLGWFYYTEADLLIYVCHHTHNIWAVATKDIKEYLHNSGKFTEKRTGNNDDDERLSYLIHLDDFRDAGYHIQEISAVG